MQYCRPQEIWPIEGLEQKMPKICALSIPLLQLLVQHPFLRIKDIAVALQVSTTTATRAVRLCVQEQLIEWIVPPLRDACRFYYLTRLGLQNIAREGRMDISDIAATYSMQERMLLRLIPRLPHLIFLYDLLDALIQDAPHLCSYADGTPAHIRWQWHLDYTHRFPYRSSRQRERCCVEAFLVLRRLPQAQNRETRDDWYAVWILTDTGLKGRDDQLWIQRRLETLVRYRESTQRVQYRVYGQFPPVLLLVPDMHQRHIWQRCASRVTLEASFGRAPLLGTILEHTDIRPGTPIETWRWHPLTPSGPVPPFPFLFSPLSEHALPPSSWMKPMEKPMAKTVLLPQGNYMKRAASLPADDKNEHREREHTALLGLRLGHRHRDLLSCLYARPLLSTVELAAMQGGTEITIRRYLSELERYRCIGKHITVHGARWWLQSRGLRLMAMDLNVPLTHIATIEKTGPTRGSLIQRGQEWLSKQMRHTAAIYDFFALLHIQARELHATVMWWEYGIRCEERYRYQGRWRNFRPDGAFEYRDADQQRRLAWVEIDLGSMGAGHLRAKFDAYAAYIASARWKEIYTHLPLLLIVVPDNAQCHRMKKVIQEGLLHSGLCIRMATAPQIQSSGLFAKIWLEVLPISFDMSCAQLSIFEGYPSHLDEPYP